MAIAARIVNGDTGAPLELRAADGRWLLDPALTEGILADPLDVTDALGTTRLVVLARNLATGEEVAMRSTSRAEPGTADAGARPAGRPARLAISAVARLNPARGAAGAPVSDGTWEIRVRTVAFGLDRSAAVTVEAGTRLPGPALAASGGLVSPGRAPDGRFVFDVTRGLSTAEVLVRLPARKVAMGGFELEVRLRAAVRRRDLPPPPRLVILEGGREQVRPTSISTRNGHVVIRGRVATRPRLRAVDGRLALHFDGGAVEGPVLDLGVIRGTRLGLRYPDNAVRVPIHRALASALRRALRRLRALPRQRADAGRAAG